MPGLNYVNKPSLDRPVLIMGFAGWPNAGEVSTGTINYLERGLDAQPLAGIDPARFYDFTEARPTTRIENGRVRDFQLPDCHFKYVRTKPGETDLILFSGQEPNLDWEGFCDEVFKLVWEMQVRAVFTLGGTYDYVPHWLTPRISAVFSCDQAEALLADEKDTSPGQYQGQVSIHTIITVRARDLGLPVVGLWGHSPVYIQTGNYKIHRSLVEILKRAVGFSLDTKDLLVDIADMDRQIESLIEESPKLKKYLEELDTGSAARSYPWTNSSGRRETDGRTVHFPFIFRMAIHAPRRKIFLVWRPGNTFTLFCNPIQMAISGLLRKNPPHSPFIKGGGILRCSLDIKRRLSWLPLK